MNLIFKTSKYKEIDFAQNQEFTVKVLENYNQIKIDAWFNNEIRKNLDAKEYTNIFIPLSIGQSYVDYLGLRFALHVRTSFGKNKCSNLFIYGTENVDKLVQNDCFDVLKLTGVKLIDYSKAAIAKAGTLLECQEFDQQEELEKVNLPLPSYLFDDHSVANVWGMYKLLELGQIDYKTIPELTERKDMTGLYLKLLMARNSLTNMLRKKPKVEQLYKASLKIKKNHGFG